MEVDEKAPAAKKPKQTDFTKEVDALIPVVSSRVGTDSGKLAVGLEELLVLEKKTRLAGDADSTKKLALAILGLCLRCKAWAKLNDHIALLCSRRAQLKKAIQATIVESAKYVEQTPDKPTKLALVEVLRKVSAGKLFVELERARLTRTLAQMKEAEGNVNEAAEILSEVQVETIGQMELREKGEILLEQLRLCLVKKDYMRAEIVAKKMKSGNLKVQELEGLNLDFQKHMITLHTHNKNFLETCKAHHAMLSIKSVVEDEKLWDETLYKTAMYLCLAIFDAEVSDFMHRLSNEKKLFRVPLAEKLLKLFTTNELIQSSAFSKEQMSALKANGVLKREGHWEAFEKAMVQHNIRTISAYYSRISMKRLSGLLQLATDKTEATVSDMVQAKQLFAKIDRPSGIVVFAKKKSANMIVDDWASDVSNLLNLVEKTCHLIHKETMMHKIRA